MLENNTDRSYFAIGAFLVGGVMISVLLAFFWSDLFGPAEYNAEAGEYEGGMIPAMMQNQFGTAPLDVEQSSTKPDGAVGLKVYDSAGREIKEDATLRPGETVTVKQTMQMPSSGLPESLSGTIIRMYGSSGYDNDNGYFEIVDSKLYDNTGSLITHDSMQPVISNYNQGSKSEILVSGSRLTSAVNDGLIKLQGEYFTQEVKLKVKDVDKYTQTPRLSTLWNVDFTVETAAGDVFEHEQPLSVKVSPEDSIVPDTRLYLANGEEITDGILYPGERVISETRFPTDTKEAAMAAGYSEKYNGEAIYLSGGAYWRPAEAADNADKKRVSVEFVDYPYLLDSDGNRMDGRAPNVIEGVAFSRGTQTLGHYLWKAKFDTFDDFNFGDEYTAIYSFDVPDWPTKLGRDEVKINTAAMEFRYYTEHPVNGGKVSNRVFGQDYLGMTIKSGTRP